METRTLTAIIERENGIYVASSPEVGITVNGPTVEEALAKLREVVQQYADKSWLPQTSASWVTTFEVRVNGDGNAIALASGDEDEVQEEADPKRQFFTARELLESGIVGLWADRTDIGDSVEFARKLREQAQRREHE